MLAILIAALAPLAASAAHAETSREREVSAILARLSQSPPALRIFLSRMPKGADLHNHLGGSVYAEDFLNWAAGDGYCANAADTDLVPPPCPAAQSVAHLETAAPAAYGRLVDAMSTRGYQEGVGADEASGHDRFFASFGKFGPIDAAHLPRVLAATIRQAAADKVSYLEEMHDPPALQAYMETASDTPLDAAGLDQAYARDSARLGDVLARASKQIDSEVAKARLLMRCGTSAAEPGCAVTVRFLAFGLRDVPPAQAFRLLTASFALARRDPRVVGVNFVMPEDWPVALRDYDLHMTMIRFLHRKFPGVPISLHAGELAFGQVPPRYLRDHIAKAVAAGARRIGHGADIAYEDHPLETMQRMKRDNIPVEINLTSNAVILGLKGRNHPMRLYLAEGVPLVLSTDDEGVLRTDMTHEYVRAVEEQGVGYPELKRLARASLNYAFISGASIWQGNRVGVLVKACARSFSSSSCKAFVAGSAKARLQVSLERQFDRFERHEIADDGGVPALPANVLLK